MLAAGLALAGCGGRWRRQDTAPAGGNRAKAARSTLQGSDLPSGWSSAPHQASPDEAAVTAQLAQCLGITDPTTRTTADVHSPDFSKGQTTTASSEVRFMRADADASADLAAFQSGKGPQCFKQTIEKALPSRLPPGASTSDLAVRQLDFPPLKDGTAAYQASLTVSLGGGINLPVYVDFVLFRAGLAEVILNTLNTGSPFDANLEKDLARKMAGRA